MPPITSNISSLSATPYVDAYSAIELVGNIQVTAWLIFALAIVWPWVCRQAGHASGKTHDVIWFVILCSSLAALIISTFVRIWI